MPDEKTKSKYTKEQRDAILARAAEIGVTNAANEAGISKWVVFQWRKMLKKKGEVVPPAPKKKKTALKSKSSSKSKTVKKKAVSEAKEVKEVKEAVSATSKVEVKKSELKKKDFSSSLEFENAILKEKNALLIQQIEKLRAAVNNLA